MALLPGQRRCWPGARAQVGAGPLPAPPGGRRFGDGVGVVRGPASGERHVRQGPRRPRIDQCVGSIDGAALRRVHRTGIAEHRGVAEIGGRDLERRIPQMLAAGRVTAEISPHRHGDGLVGKRVDGVGLDAPDVAIRYPSAVTVLNGAAVRPGLDEIPGAGVVAVGVRDRGVLLDQAEPGEVGAGAGGQLCGLLVGRGDEQGVAAADAVGEPMPICAACHLLGGALGKPSVPVVVGQRGGVAVAQAQRGFPLPSLLHALHGGELVVAVLAGEHGEGPASADAGKLGRVADEQQLGAGLLG